MINNMELQVSFVFSVELAQKSVLSWAYDPLDIFQKKELAAF